MASGEGLRKWGSRALLGLLLISFVVACASGEETAEPVSPTPNPDNSSKLAPDGQDTILRSITDGKNPYSSSYPGEIFKSAPDNSFNNPLDYFFMLDEIGAINEYIDKIYIKDNEDGSSATFMGCTTEIDDIWHTYQENRGLSGIDYGLDGYLIDGGEYSIMFLEDNEGSKRTFPGNLMNNAEFDPDSYFRDEKVSILYRLKGMDVDHTYGLERGPGEYWYNSIDGDKQFINNYYFGDICNNEAFFPDLSGFDIADDLIIIRSAGRNTEDMVEQEGEYEELKEKIQINTSEMLEMQELLAIMLQPLIDGAELVNEAIEIIEEEVPVAIDGVSNFGTK